eukprot:SAG31_NODE_21872_length_539_cov_0.547727_2_plen_27_part_01
METIHQRIYATFNGVDGLRVAFRVGSA